MSESCDAMMESDATERVLKASRMTIYTEIKEWLTQYHEEKQGNEKRAMRLLKAVVAFFDREDETRLKGSDSGNVVIKALSEIKNSINQLETKTGKADNAHTTPRSYAAAAMATRRGCDTDMQKTSKTMEEKRKLKTTILRVSNPKEKVDVRMTTTKDLLDEIGAVMGDEKKPTALRRLPSGDLEVHMASVADRKWAENTNEWKQAVAGSANTIRRTYAVMAHGVRMANVDTTNQGEAIKRLTLQNKRIHRELRIIRVAWTKRAVDAKKKYSSLIIEVDEAAMANNLLKDGFIEEHELKTCELFSKDCRLTQCYNCQQYGHIARVCKNKAACGHCAKDHESRNCNDKTYIFCAVCQKQGHEAWSSRCPARMKEKSRSSVAFAKRPVLYTVEEEETSINTASVRETAYKIVKPRGQKRAMSVRSSDSDSEERAATTAFGRITTRASPANKGREDRATTEAPFSTKSSWGFMDGNQTTVPRPGPGRPPKKKIIATVEEKGKEAEKETEKNTEKEQEKEDEL